MAAEPARGFRSTGVDEVDEIRVENDLEANHPDAVVALDLRDLRALYSVLPRNENDVFLSAPEGIARKVEVVAELKLRAVDVVTAHHRKEPTRRGNARSGQGLSARALKVGGNRVDVSHLAR